MIVLVIMDSYRKHERGLSKYEIKKSNVLLILT